MVKFTFDINNPNSNFKQFRYAVAKAKTDNQEIEFYKLNMEYYLYHFIDCSYWRCFRDMFNDVIKPKLAEGNNIILSAHGNSIRSIVMNLFKYSPEEILKAEIGWCEPIVYTFDQNLLITDFKYIPRPSEKSKSNFPKNVRLKNYLDSNPK